jgi:hypothetical protein
MWNATKGGRGDDSYLTGRSNNLVSAITDPNIDGKYLHAASHRDASSDSAAHHQATHFALYNHGGISPSRLAPHLVDIRANQSTSSWLSGRLVSP